MRDIVRTTIFKRDYKRCIKRGCSKQKLAEVLELLVHDQALPDRYRPHRLSGQYRGLWECHITPDWLLIYDYPNEEELELRRMGSHADLFH